MIIGETFNQNSYYGYEEENYDYLFKRKSKEERQQKKEERKQKRTEKKLQKQDSASGGKRRLPILGNFGLFDKNKKNAGTSGGATSSSAKKEPGDTSESSTGEEKRIAMASVGAAASQDKAEGSKTSGGESEAEGSSAKLESKELDKGSNPKKEAGFGPMFGFAMLGITVLFVGAVLYGVNKKSNPAPQSLKVAA